MGDRKKTKKQIRNTEQWSVLQIFPYKQGVMRTTDKSNSALCSCTQESIRSKCGWMDQWWPVLRSFNCSGEIWWYLGPGRSSTDGEKWVDSVQVLEAKELGPDDEVDVGGEGEEGVKMTHRFGSSNWVNGGFTEGETDWERKENQESWFDLVN